MANPDPQTMIDALTATYTTLASQLETQLSDDGRTSILQKLEDVRGEIEYWEKRRDRTTRAGNAFTKARPVR